MSGEPSSDIAPRTFPNTRWSVVLAARLHSPESDAAIETICRAYWYPLYAYVRRSGHGAHDSQDLTQEFFCRLLEKRWLDAADREKGRLRSFLVVMLKHFMRKQWRRASTQRRGGGSEHVPFDGELAESRYAADGQTLEPDETFDRQWALTLLELAVNRLRGHFTTADKAAEFETLKPCLIMDRGALDYAAVAKQLGINEAAARVAVHRLRKQFRKIYREEIMQTLAEGEDLAEEMRYLATALRRTSHELDA